MLDRVLIDGERPVRDTVPREVGLHPTAPGLAHAPGARGVGQRFPQRPAEPGDVAGLHQPAGLAVHHHFGETKTAAWL